MFLHSVMLWTISNFSDSIADNRYLFSDFRPETSGQGIPAALALSNVSFLGYILFLLANSYFSACELLPLPFLFHVPIR